MVPGQGAMGDQSSIRIGTLTSLSLMAGAESGQGFAGTLPNPGTTAEIGRPHVPVACESLPRSAARPIRGMCHDDPREVPRARLSDWTYVRIGKIVSSYTGRL